MDTFSTCKSKIRVEITTDKRHPLWRVNIYCLFHFGKIFPPLECPRISERYFARFYIFLVNQLILKSNFWDWAIWFVNISRWSFKMAPSAIFTHHLLCLIGRFSCAVFCPHGPLWYILISYLLEQLLDQMEQRQPDQVRCWHCNHVNCDLANSFAPKRETSRSLVWQVEPQRFIRYLCKVFPDEYQDGLDKYVDPWSCGGVVLHFHCCYIFLQSILGLDDLSTEGADRYLGLLLRRFRAFRARVRAAVRLALPAMPSLDLSRATAFAHVIHLLIKFWRCFIL